MENTAKIADTLNVQKSQTEIQEAFLTLGKEGYSLDMDYDKNVAICKRIAKRSKIGYKKVFAYRFRNTDQMLEHCVKYFNDKTKALQDEIESKKARKIQNEIDKENVKVGDIFCYSWGWEQTNVDLWQVAEKPSKGTIIIRPISTITVEETSWASENCKADIDNFIGAEEKVRLNGGSFKRSCGYARKVQNPKTDTFYRSWYA